jgi:hypothetical protein
MKVRPRSIVHVAHPKLVDDVGNSSRYSRARVIVVCESGQDHGPVVPVRL